VGALDSNLWFQSTGIAAVIAVAMVLNLLAATLSGVAIPPTRKGSLAKVEAMLHSSLRVREALLRAPNRAGVRLSTRHPHRTHIFVSEAFCLRRRRETALRLRAVASGQR
jgi:hypothetical protein